MNKNLINLNMLPTGKKGLIEAIETTGQIRRRMLDLGMIKGTKIEPIYESPLGDTRAYFVRGTVIALRKEDATHLQIREMED